MILSFYQKTFGIGPFGALISAATFLFVWLLDRFFGHLRILTDPQPIRYAALIVLLFGVFLHFWTFFTLRNWWKGDELCTKGPFRFFRHPMYAAWISFISMAVALFLNSWLLVFWSLALHPFWHTLVKKEEKWMEQRFGSAYKSYAAKTGRFFPKIFRGAS